MYEIDLDRLLFPEVKRGFLERIKLKMKRKEYAEQRAKKGFCDVDLESLNEYLTMLLINALESYKTLKYVNVDGNRVCLKDYVIEIAMYFRLSLDGGNYINKYRREYLDLVGRTVEKKLDNTDVSISDKEAEIINGYLKREEEIKNERRKNFEIGWAMLGNVFRHLWE